MSSIPVGLVTGKRTISITEFPRPEPAPGKAVVDISYCGICGTDVHAFLSGEAYNPAICGHEWVGNLSAINNNSQGYREGDRVAIGVPSVCGQCSACRRGDAEHCEFTFAAAIGVGPLASPHGGFAPALAFAENRLYKVDSKLSDEAAALLEPVTVAVHAVRRTGIRLGDSVVVLGGGPIGLLTLQAAIAAGAGFTALVEPEAVRRELARTLGANLVLDPNEDDVPNAIDAAIGAAGADVVFECAGIAATIQTAVDLVRRGGAVSLVGVPAQPSTIHGAGWLIKEVKLTSSIAYLHEEFELAQSLVVDGRIKTDLLHTQTVNLAGMQEAFETLATQPAQVKILVDPRVT